jgi:hypothetical protein
MWIRKTSLELIQERWTRQFFTVGGTLTALAAIAIAVTQYPIRIDPVARGLAFLLGAAFLAASLRTARNHRLRRKLLVCETCNLATVNHIAPGCICGGKLSPITELKQTGAASAAQPAETRKPAVSLSHAV